MKHKVFTVYDRASAAYLQPFFLQTVGQAVRAFADCVNDFKHQFYRHPADYTLFELGEFDDETATFSLLAGPQSHGNAVQYLVERQAPLFDEAKEKSDA